MVLDWLQIETLPPVHWVACDLLPTIVDLSKQNPHQLKWLTSPIGQWGSSVKKTVDLEYSKGQSSPDKMGSYVINLRFTVDLQT